MHRRRFLSTVVALGGASLLEVRPAKGQEENTRTWITVADGQFDPFIGHAHGFGDAYGRNDILSQSFTVLHSRFRSPDVAQNTYDVIAGQYEDRDNRHGYSIDDAAWERANIAGTYHPGHLLWKQLEILRLPDSALEEGDEGTRLMPDIHLYAYHEESSVHGHVKTEDIGCVSVYWDGTAYRRTGEFKVWLNTYNLGAADHRSSPYHWASVIGHEMLHCLGHLHPPGGYGDHIQINAFHRSLFCDGKFNPGVSTVPHWGCGKPTI